MEGIVKCALYALSEMQKSADSWSQCRSKWYSVFQRGYIKRQALRSNCLGLVFHDRILAGRPIERPEHDQR